MIIWVKQSEVAVEQQEAGSRIGITLKSLIVGDLRNLGNVVVGQNARATHVINLSCGMAGKSMF